MRSDVARSAFREKARNVSAWIWCMELVHETKQPFSASTVTEKQKFRFALKLFMFNSSFLCWSAPFTIVSRKNKNFLFFTRCLTADLHSWSCNLWTSTIKLFKWKSCIRQHWSLLPLFVYSNVDYVFAFNSLCFFFASLFRYLIEVFWKFHENRASNNFTLRDDEKTSALLTWEKFVFM